MKKLASYVKVLFITLICFNDYITYSQCSETDLTDNCRPVRIAIFYLSGVKTLESERLLLRDDLISGVGNANKSIMFSKYPSNDNDPQRFEIARICIIDENLYNWQRDYIKSKEQSICFNDLNMELNSGQLGTSDGGCPADALTSCITGIDGWWAQIGIQAISNNQIAHELGHAMGCDHWIYSDQDCERAIKYNHEYNFNYYGNDGFDSTNRSTPGAYSNHRINGYSNPNVYYQNDSDPNKVLIGTSVPNQLGTAFCSQSIYETKQQIRNLCTTAVDFVIVPVEPLPQDYNGEIILPGELSDIFAKSNLSMSEYQYIISKDAIVQFRAGTKIHIKHGFHAKSGCKFKAFINDGTTRGFYGNE